MNPINRPEDGSPASIVFDMMSAVASDPDISTALLEDEIMHGWITVSLFNALSKSDLDIDVELVNIRTCNYPLDQYDTKSSLPNVNYRSTVYLRSGGWLIDSSSVGAPTTQSELGFAAFPDEESAIAREITHRANPSYSTWFHDVERPKGAPYTGARTPLMVANAIKKPLAMHLANQMRRDTPEPKQSQAPGPRF